MDGVLVDGEPLHFEAVNRLLGEEGKSISLEAYKPYMGTKSGWSDMIAAMGLTKPKTYYSERYREIIIRQYEEKSEALPGALAFVGKLRAARVPLAVCSSSIKPWVDACLSRLGLTASFDRIITGSDVEAGKPDPAIYLLAAERLGVAPASCLAVEDAPAGITSAKRAGMTVWAVRTEYTRGLVLPDPDLELESLEDADLSRIVGVAA